MGEPFLGLNAVSGRAIDPEEAGVNDWFNAVKPLILDEVEEHGEVVPVNRPEILSALAFMNFGLYQWTHRLPIMRHVDVRPAAHPHRRTAPLHAVRSRRVRDRQRGARHLP